MAPRRSSARSAPVPASSTRRAARATASLRPTVPTASPGPHAEVDVVDEDSASEEEELSPEERARAIALGERRLAVLERLRRPDPIRMAQLLYDLGRLHGDGGDEGAAKGLLERSLALVVRQTGPASVDTAGLVRELMSLDPSATSTTTVLHPDLLVTGERLHDDTMVVSELEDLAKQLEELATAYRLGFAMPECVELLERALAILEHLQGRDQQDREAIPRILSDIGMCKGAQGRCAESILYYERARAIYVRRHGPDHVDVAKVIGRAGCSLVELGDFAGAREHFQQSLDMYERIHAYRDHEDVVDLLCRLGRLHISSLKEHDTATGLLERALAMATRLHGADAEDVADVLVALGELHQFRDNFAQAQEYLERALAIYEKMAPQYVPDVADTLHSLGIVYKEQGQYSKAMEVLKRSLALYERRYGAVHVHVATVVHEMGHVLAEANDYAQSETLHRRALVLYEQHGDTKMMAQALYAIAITQLNQCDFHGARQSLSRSISLSEQPQWAGGPPGTVYPDTLGAMGYVLYQLHDYSAAEGYLLRALAGHELVRPEERSHKEAQDNFFLGQVQEHLGDLGAARGAYERARELWLAQGDARSVMALDYLTDVIEHQRRHDVALRGNYLHKRQPPHHRS